jgi:diphthamide synthase (EF-2-diphthine--ammonia ligase)
LIHKYLARESWTVIAKSLEREVGGILARLLKLSYESRGISLQASALALEHRGVAWSVDDEELLEALVKRGTDLTLIAQMFSRTQWAIAYKTVELRMANPLKLDPTAY